MPNITIGCKLPFGLTLQVAGHSVVLNGSQSSSVIGGYGLTQVDESFWSTWVEKNSDHEILKKNLIFAQTTVSKAKDEATEKKDITSGYQPLAGENVDKTGVPIART